MFDLVSKYRKWIMVALFVMIIPPFALFGIDTYFQGGVSAQTVARVGDYEITEQEFAQAMREQHDMLRNLAGGRIDPALLESPEQRAAVLDNLISQRVLIEEALRSGLIVTDQHLRAFIEQIPAFQEDGKFSMARYQEFLNGRGWTASVFENRLRHDLLIRMQSEAYADTSFAPRSVAERLLRLTEQQREVSRAVISPEKFTAEVKLEEGAAKKYYAENQSEFRTPEQARVEYVTLSAEALMPTIEVDPAEVKKYFEANQGQFAVPETREASHILIAVDKDADAPARKKAAALAQQIAEEARKNPSRFAELAKKYSQDPGSAAKGGELGSFSRGQMVKAFDEAVFSLKPGEISAPVETEYGYHVIRVTGVTPGKGRSFEEARPEIEREMKRHAASRAFAERAEKLNNIAFEQHDTLKGAAELLKQTPQTSGWITRSAAEDPRLNNPRLLEAIFSEDVLVNKHNTEAIEVAPGTIVVARVAERRPATVQPFEQVKSAIEKKLIERRAAQLAAQEGRQQLEALRQGKDTKLAWSAPQIVSRTDPKGLNEPVLRQVFRADATNLPSYTGIEAPGGGYLLLRVSRVIDPSTIDRAQQKALGEGLAQALGQEQFGAYVETLKQKSEVRINKDYLEKQQQ